MGVVGDLTPDFFKNINEDLLIPVWKNHDLSVIAKFCADDIDVHTTFSQGRGAECARESFETLFRSFPVLNLKVEELIVYDRRITYKWSAYAEQKAPIASFAVAHKPLQFNGIVFLVFNEKGLITKYHSFSNIPQMLQSALAEQQIEVRDSAENVALEWSDLLFVVAKQTHVNLTARELQCLYYWVAGYSIKETARNLGDLSGKTIQVFRDNIRKKFNTNTYHDLIRLLHNSGALSRMLDANVPIR